MTDDDATTPIDDGPPAAPDAPDAANTDQANNAPDADQATAARRRRRRLIGVGIGVAAVLILLVCASLGALAAGFGRLARAADDNREAHARADAACLELERRLNRLAPPGATTNPRQRATAIRDENAAVRPFLAEIDQLPGRWYGDGNDDRGGRHGWADSWRELMSARDAYATALDRQAGDGEPAFFLAPQDRHGRPVVDQVQHGPRSCAGAVRRLGAPDL